MYKLLVTDLGGEKRFAAAVARRLQSLGALTRGDRRAASGVDLSDSNFDSPLGRKSLRCAPPAPGPPLTLPWNSNEACSFCSCTCGSLELRFHAQSLLKSPCFVCFGDSQLRFQT